MPTEDGRPTEEELRADENRRKDAEDFRLAKTMEELVRFPQWDIYVLALERKMQEFADSAVAKSFSMDHLIAREFDKGTLYGLLLAKGLPQATIDSMAQVPHGDVQEIEETE